MRVSVDIGSGYDFALTKALLIYEPANRQNNTGVFVSLHEVTGGDQPSLGPATPLTRRFITTLQQGLEPSHSIEVLPENVIARTPEMMAWWTPASVRPMFFSANAEKVSGLNRRQFPHPALVFVVRGRSLSVRALGESARPQAASRLYTAPYWNTDQSGSVCLGTAHTPEAYGVEGIPGWEKCFFGSEFSHAIGVQKITAHPGGFSSMWEELAGQANFPAEYLVDSGQTLGDYLRAHSK